MKLLKSTARILTALSVMVSLIGQVSSGTVTAAESKNYYYEVKSLILNSNYNYNNFYDVNGDGVINVFDALRIQKENLKEENDMSITIKPGSISVNDEGTIKDVDLITGNSKEYIEQSVDKWMDENIDDIKNDLKSDVNEVKREMAVQEARMDQLVGTVPEGSADEIADARVTADGKTEANLGNAIRSQVSGLKETIDTVYDAVVDETKITNSVIGVNDVKFKSSKTGDVYKLYISPDSKYKIEINNISGADNIAVYIVDNDGSSHLVGTSSQSSIVFTSVATNSVSSYIKLYATKSASASSITGNIKIHCLNDNALVNRIGKIEDIADAVGVVAVKGSGTGDVIKHNLNPLTMYRLDCKNITGYSTFAIYLYKKDGKYNLLSDKSGGDVSLTFVTQQDIDYIKIYAAKSAGYSDLPYFDFCLYNSNDEISGLALYDKNNVGWFTNKFELGKSGDIFDIIVDTDNTYNLEINDIKGADSLAAYVFNNDGTYRSLGIKYPTNNKILYENIITDDNSAYIHLYGTKSTSTATMSGNIIVKNASKNTVAGALMNIEKSNNVKLFGNKTCKIFKKVVCCGDSYTAGAVVDAGGGHWYNPDYSWVHYMATETGEKWLDAAYSGYTTLDWLTKEYGLQKAKTYGASQAYVVGLMINDQSTDESVHVPLGTPSDIGTDNPTTYYGGMSKIIRELAKISPNAHIFINTCPKTGSSYDDYNNAVRIIVNTYNSTYKVHCIDLAADYLDYYSDLESTADYNGHFSAWGYECAAEIYEKALSDYINKNVSSFRDVYNIPYTK